MADDCIIVESETQTQRDSSWCPGIMFAWQTTTVQETYSLDTYPGCFWGKDCTGRTIRSELQQGEGHQNSTGGSFGGKQEYLFEPVTSFYGYGAETSVKLLLDQEECIIHTRVRPAVNTKIKTVVTKSGKLQEFIADSTLDAGAFSGSAPDYARSLSLKVTKLYRIPHYKHTGRAVYTNTVKSGGARGWAALEITLLQLKFTWIRLPED
ncbi:MAG: molybdopterin cofactor-binding domain-containing protein [Syntrophaceticus schinkii]